MISSGRSNSPTMHRGMAPPQGLQLSIALDQERLAPARWPGLRGARAAGPPPRTATRSLRRGRARGDNLVFTEAAAARTCERTCLPWKFEDFRVLLRQGGWYGRTFEAIDDVGTRERVSDEWASTQSRAKHEVFRLKPNLRRGKTARAVRSCGRARHTNWRWRRRVRLLVPSLRRPPRAGRRVRPRAPSSAPRRPEGGETPRRRDRARSARRASRRCRTRGVTRRRTAIGVGKADGDIRLIRTPCLIDGTPDATGVPAGRSRLEKGDGTSSVVQGDALHERAADASTPTRASPARKTSGSDAPSRDKKPLAFWEQRAGSRSRSHVERERRLGERRRHLAAEAMVMEEAILLTGESGECCDGR